MTAMNIPKHVGIIMDGNGRWAQKKGAVRVYGHRFGTETVRTAISYASNAGIEYLTLFAFSTENWKRPQAEISAIMSLIAEYLDNETDEMDRNNVVLNFIGDLSMIPKDSLAAINRSVEQLRNNTGLKVNIALNYGGRDDITRSAKRIAEKVKHGELDINDITEKTLNDNLYLPVDCDLIIRTGAEKRISNFLTWQGAYAEIYFTDVLWPDFDDNEFENALRFYSERDRRYGGIKQ